MKNVSKVEKGFLRQAVRNRNLFFTMAVMLSILFVSSYSETAEIQKKVKQKQDKTYKQDRPYKEAIEADGYKYIYEGVPTKNIESEEIYYKGKITIRDKDNNVLYQETMDLEPQFCHKFPKISKIPFTLRDEPNRKKWLVIICGDSGGAGKHQMLKIFYKHMLLQSTSLHFYDTTPNLSDIDGNGFYEAIVYRRVLLEGIGYGVVHYLTIYKLNIDSTMFGFIPEFSSNIADKYFDYYMRLKKSLKSLKDESLSNSDYTGPMLAALLAAQDKDKICGEMKTLQTYGLSNQDLQAWIKRIKSLGYPDFDINICKEVSK